MNNKNQGAEKRQSRRVQARFTIIYDVYNPLSVSMRIGNKEVDALMLDLSRFGMAISTNYDIPVSTVIRMKFTLINRNDDDKENRVKTIELLGQVRYNTALQNNEYRLGICFTQIKDQDLSAIDRFVELTSGRI